MFNREEFRQLTSVIIAAEKPGFWSDWTPEQQQAYLSGDWRAFSTSRGYSEQEIAEYALWQNMINDALQNQINPFCSIRDLALEAATKNKTSDIKGEIEMSSHITCMNTRHLELTIYDIQHNSSEVTS
jgi:hypothetical protein